MWLLRRVLRLGRRLFKCLVNLRVEFVDIGRVSFFSHGDSRLWIERFYYALGLRYRAGDKRKGGFSFSFLFFSLTLVYTLKRTVVNED